jgi:hypothetical protein
MSVRTTADENLDRIRELLKELTKDLAVWFVDDHVWGRDEYSDEFEEKVEEALTHLRSAKKLLG